MPDYTDCNKPLTVFLETFSGTKVLLRHHITRTEDPVTMGCEPPHFTCCRSITDDCDKDYPDKACCGKEG